MEGVGGQMVNHIVFGGGALDVTTMGLGICLQTGKRRDLESGLEIGDWIGGWGVGT